jgi:hypothetical protein
LYINQHIREFHLQIWDYHNHHHLEVMVFGM